jgi:signal transduction histidine kinase
MSDERLGLVRAERVRELYGRPGTPIYTANIIFAVAAVQSVAMIWPVTDHVRVLVWIGLMLAVQLGLAALVRAFHSRPREPHELERWGRRRAVAEVVHGLAWAMAIPLVYRHGEMVTLISVMALISGLVGGIAAGLAVHMPSIASFLAASLPPAIAFLLLARTGSTEVYAALMLVGAGALTLANARRMSRLYEEAIRLRLDLATQVTERRRLQEEAEEGRRLAEEAAADRTRFFGAASHDLRQPVHALGLYASLLRRDPGARERRDLIDKIGACIDSLDRLFTAILGVAQAAQAKAGGQVAAIPLQEVFERVLLQYRLEAEQKGLVLRHRPTTAWVRGDPAVIERILTNLVGNAVHYTDAGGVLLAARRRGGAIDLVVADTGVGIGAADRQRVFDAFFQVQPSPQGRRKGYGLGLATVRQLCLTYGYEIQVRSEPGRGSCFRVCIPQVAPLAISPPAVADPSVPARQNVLLVEDDPLVSDAISRLLTAWDVNAQVCKDGETAMAILEAGGPGRWHAILDYRLDGEETGLDIADRIHARYGPVVSVSLLTGEGDPAVFAAAKQRGVLVLHKPLKPIRLRALLGAPSVGSPVG